MKVTVAIPHYRSERSLRIVLEALSHQKFCLRLKRDLEVIVVNDEEKEIQGLEIFYKKLNLICISQAHSGPAAARNRAISIAMGDYIFFLDSDSIPRYDWLNSMYVTFFENSEITAVGGKVEPFPQSGIVNDFYNFFNPLEKPKMNPKNKEVIYIITANCGFKKDVLKSIKGFSKGFYCFRPGGEDLDLSFRLRQAGYRLYFQPLAIVKHIYPKEFLTITKKNLNYGVGLRRYIELNHISPAKIRQPQLNLKYFFPHLFFQTIKNIKRIFCNYKVLPLKKIIIFFFFLQIQSFFFSYGYFFGRNSFQKFKYEA